MYTYIYIYIYISLYFGAPGALAAPHADANHHDVDRVEQVRHQVVLIINALVD